MAHLFLWFVGDHNLLRVPPPPESPCSVPNTFPCAELAVLRTSPQLRPFIPHPAQVLSPVLESWTGKH